MSNVQLTINNTHTQKASTPCRDGAKRAQAGTGRALREQLTNQQPANTNPQPLIRHSPFAIRHSQFIILFILFIAAFFRFYQLPQLPPGLNFDEAGNGVAALDILAGSPEIWWPIGGGKEPLWPYIVAFSAAIFGPTSFALRFPAAVVGILTVAAVYPLVRTLFRGYGQSQLVALFTMLGLAVSVWHLHFSRLGFRAILLPLFSILAFYFFWRSLAHRFTSPTIVFRRNPSVTRENVKERKVEDPPGLWRVIQPVFWLTRHISPEFIRSAVFLALAIYSYLAARLLPLVIILFLLTQWLLNRKRHSHSHPSSLIPHPSSLISNPKSQIPLLPPLARLFLPLLLFLSPLIIYFILNPAEFAARSTTVSIFNPAWHQGDLSGTAWQTLTLTLSTFLGLQGDANPLVNLPHQPALPLFLAPLFVIGLIVSLYRIITNNQLPILPSLPLPNSPNSQTYAPPKLTHLLLLCWWLVMLLPAILAPEGAPHHLRLIGTIIPTYTFVALGIIIITNLLLRLMHYSVAPQHLHYLGESWGEKMGGDTPRPAARYALPPTQRATHPSLPSLARRYLLPATYYLLPAICYLLLTLHTYSNYFIRWPKAVDFTLPFDLYATRLAAQIVQAPANVAYILPMDIRAGSEARHYTVDYLLGRPWMAASSAQSGFTYIPVDEHNAETLLGQAVKNNSELRVVRWTADKHREADAKEIITYLLETSAQLLGRESFPVYDVEIYAIANKLLPAAFTLPDIQQPVDTVLDDTLRIANVYVAPTAEPGTQLPIALTFAPLTSIDTNFKASVRLVSPTGQRVVQKDRLLLHNFHQGTSLWPPETVNEYYLLPVPPDASPGHYTITVVIYHPDTLAPLTADGLVEIPLGTSRIE